MNIKSFNQFFKESQEETTSKSLEKSIRDSGYSTIISRICLVPEIPAEATEITSFDYDVDEATEKVVEVKIGFKFGTKALTLEIHDGMPIVSKYSLGSKLDINILTAEELATIAFIHRLAMVSSYCTGIWNASLSLAQKIEAEKADKSSIFVKEDKVMKFKKILAEEKAPEKLKLNKQFFLDNIIGADDVTISRDGLVTIYNGFYYSKEGYPESLKNSVIAVGKEYGFTPYDFDYDQVWKPFKGSASVKASSHYKVSFRIKEV